MQTTDKYLTLLFEPSKPITLQYHPNSLSLTQKSNSNSVLGLQNIMTYIAKPDTAFCEIRFNATVTALDALTKDSSITKTELLAATGGGVLVSNLSSIDQVGNLISATSNTISLAKGIIDLTVGLIRTSEQVTKATEWNEQQIKNIEFLRKANRETLPCTINWDIETQTRGKQQKYFIKDLNIDVRSIQEETGVTLAFLLDVVLSQYGKPVRI